MAYSLTWLPEVLRGAGLKVAETEGWASRGRGEMGRVRGVMCHHTGTAGGGNMPTLGLLKRGRSDLAGPLAQLGLGRDGTYYVVAAGRANHAGAGKWRGVETGNSSFIGIEGENGGLREHNWPDVQMDAYQRGVAAILKHVGAEADMCCGHREYALPPGRKIDPLFNMDDFRSTVRDIMLGVAKVRPLIAPVDENGRPTLRRGARGEDVKFLQTKLELPDDGLFGPRTEAAVRQYQRRQGDSFVADGIVGPKTWERLLAS